VSEALRRQSEAAKMAALIKIARNNEKTGLNPKYEK